MRLRGLVTTLALYTTVTALLISTTWGTSPSNHGDFAGNAPVVAPAIFPGDYITMSCTHGSLYLNGTLECHDVQQKTMVLCSGPTGTVCGYSLSGAPDQGYESVSWSASGQSCLGPYPSCQTSANLNPVNYQTFGSGTGIYSGTLTLSVATGTSQVENLCLDGWQFYWQSQKILGGPAAVQGGAPGVGPAIGCSSGNSLPLFYEQNYSIWAGISNPPTCGFGGDCPGAAQFKATFWWNLSLSFTYTLAQTSHGSASVDYTYANWNDVSEAAQSGCSNGDNAGGGGSILAGMMLKNSAQQLISQGTYYFYTAPNASCYSQNTVLYSTGAIGLFPSGSSVRFGLDGLPLVNGASYTLIASIGCYLYGYTYGPNMGSDTETSAITYCGINGSGGVGASYSAPQISS